MEQSELEELLHDVEELKRAVRRNNPFLREVMSTRFYSAVGLGFGLVFIVYCLAAQLLASRYESLASVPSGWKLTGIIAFAVIALVGAVGKWVFFSRRAKSLDEGASYLTVLKAVYGSSWVHVILPALICMAFAVPAAIVAGHPWLIVAGAAIGWAFACNTLGLMIQRLEYLVAGWYALATGLPALLFMESKPFLWSGIIWGGALILFGIVGLAASKRGSRA
ncbi:MAG TPA: hypothetical protein VMC79_08710 [Rectinemataceae bacterium]|nr:hypothetical protein [Rectinemataceae bacterium]